MTTINKTKIVPYSPQKMYELVNQIEAYPEFLPWCSSSQILHRNEDEVKASLSISAHGFTKPFTTHNLLQKNKMIEIRLIDGPFKHLEGFWRFESLDEDKQCQIFFDIEFEFSNKLLSFTLTPLFSQIADTMVDAFCSRAEKLYGKPD